VGANPDVLIGAILAGATFGDSISPISDTTIASAGTQGADIGGVVRSRLKYVVPAGLLAMLASAALDATRSSAAGAVAAAIPVSARGLPMLVVPALVIGLLVAQRHLIEGLLLGILATVVLGLALGLIAPSAIVHVDRASFGAKGLIVDGMGRGVGASVFTILLVGLVATLQATGALDRLVHWATRPGTTARGTEAWIVAAVSERCCSRPTASSPCLPWVRWPGAAARRPASVPTGAPTCST